MNKIILVVLAALTLSGCDTRDHQKSFAWAKEFCGESGISSFYTYGSIADSVYCNNGSRADIPVK